MSVLARSWFMMSACACVVALLLAASSSMPRLLWLTILMGAAFFKARLILLDYLELRGVPTWQSGAIAGLTLLIAAIALLSAV